MKCGILTELGFRMCKDHCQEDKGGFNSVASRRIIGRSSSTRNLWSIVYFIMVRREHMTDGSSGF